MDFKEQLDADLTNVFFKTGEGAEFTEEEWMFRPAIASDGGGDYLIAVIPDATTEEVQPQGKGTQTQGRGARVQSQYIRVLVKEADILGGIQVHDRITGRGKVFKIVQIDSDGVGTISLILHEDPNASP